ncbi:MAG: 30S ribosomal protein S8 [Polyangiaceae bacterium]|nr:30S ribosomal protein S8 [Polyangiaceae bacterium]
MVTDPVSDMLARLRNAIRARHDRLELPSSKLKKGVAEILKQTGYIADVRENEQQGRKSLMLVLKYGRNREAAIDGVRRISRPGRRVYVGHDKIPPVFFGLGMSILSTSQGLMSDGEARRRKVGGELLCEVW